MAYLITADGSTTGWHLGTWVTVKGRWRPGETMRVRQVSNLTTGASFGVRGGVGKALAIAIFVVIALVVLAMFAVGLLFVFNDNNSGVPQPRRTPPPATRVVPGQRP